MKPMEGVNVLEFSTMITASLAAMMLAEQGARVVKVEPHRARRPHALPRQQQGRHLVALRQLQPRQALAPPRHQDASRTRGDRGARARDTDIVLCNFRPGVMDTLGLGSDALRAINPRLIYAAVSGFGPKGPMRDQPAYDPVIQAQSGYAAVQGQGRDSMEFVRNLTCDKITAYTAFQAVTAALYVRERSGSGQHIELSMMDAGLYFLFPDGFMHHTLLDEDAEHLPPLSELLYEMTVTSDGAITVSAANQAQQVGLLTALDKLHLFADERFNSLEKIVANITEFREILREACLEFTTDELLARLAEKRRTGRQMLELRRGHRTPPIRGQQQRGRTPAPRARSDAARQTTRSVRRRAPGPGE